MAKLVVCGAINRDITCFVQHLPAPGEEVTVKDIERVFGGTGANVAVAAARILGPEEVALIGALGEDDIARQQVVALAAEGVITEGIAYLPDKESGQAYILVDEQGQNIIASCVGANAGLRPEHLTGPAVQRLFQECQGLVLTDPPLDVVSQLIASAKERGIPVLWDPGILVGQRWETLQSFARRVDILFLNEAEATALLGTAESNVSLQHLREAGFGNYIVLKRGGQGAALLAPGAGTVLRVPALPLKGLGLSVVNTVGCGDVFVGVFAAYHMLGASLQKSLIMASVAAGFNATRPETRGSPGRAVLESVEERSRNLGFALQEHRLS